MTTAFDPTWTEPLDELDRQAATETDDPTATPIRSAGPRPKPQPTGTGRHTPTHDLDAERAALGSMLTALEAIDIVHEAGVTPGDYYNPFHAAVHQTILDLATTGAMPDIVTVSGQLLDRWPDARLKVFELQAADDYMWTSAARYSDRILTHARSRRLQAAALAVAEAASRADLTEAVDRVNQLEATAAGDTRASTWTPIDLAAILDGDGPPAPSMLERDDGQNLIYDGKVHSFNAEPESGKSWLAQWACVERLIAGDHVLYLDFEDNPADIAARLRHLGATTEQISTRFHYIRPDDPIDTVATAALERALTEYQPRLAIIDGVTEVMVQNGWSIIDNDDAARFLLALPRRIARHGTAVILIDHVPKDRDNRGRGGIGAQHKLAGIDGATYTLEVTTPFGRGRSGTARLIVEKDRPGHIRGGSVEGRFAAQLRINSLPDGDVHIQIAAHTDGPTDRQIRPTTLMDKVSTTVEELNAAGIEPTRNQILTDVPGKKQWVSDALRRLITEGHISVIPGPNRAHFHRSNRPYRSVDDPRSEAYNPTGEPPTDTDPEEL